MEPVTIEDLFRFSFYGGLKACGKNIVFVRSVANEQKNKYDTDLMLCRNGKIRQLTDRKTVSSFIFENKNTIWFAQENKEGSRTDLMRMSLKGGEAVSAFAIEKTGVSLVDFLDPTRVVLRIEENIRPDLDEHASDYEVLDEYPWYFNGRGFISGLRTQICIYDLESCELSEPVNIGLKAGAICVHDGKIYFMAKEDQGRFEGSLCDSLYVYDPTSNQTDLLSKLDMDTYTLNAIENRLYFFASNGQPIGENSNPCLYACDIETGKMERVMDWKESLGNTVGTDCAAVGGNMSIVHDGKLYFTGTIVSHVNLFSFEDDSLHQILEWPGTIHSFAFCKGQLVFIGAKPGELQELYTLEEGTVRQISHLQNMEDKFVSEAKPVFYDGSQGSSQMGWVLYPKDFDPNKTYPGILDIHGGPKTVYGTVFYHEMQVWASKGYFVFFCNPFGSDGQGNDYADLRGKYGTDDYKDLMNFTDAVLNEVPQIDPKRLGVTGGSYGGYMTNWIVTHTDRFKAAATQRSISNWISFWGTSDIGPSFAADQQQAGLDNPDKLWEHSPMKYITNAKTPTLLIHSDEDYRCPIEQGYQMLAGLLSQGVEAKMVLFHGENHELSRSGKPLHRVRRLKEITDWMDAHLKGNSHEA